MEEEIELLQILKTLRKRWMLVVMLPLIAVVISWFVNYYVIKPSYEATTTLIISQTNPSSPQSAGKLDDYKALLQSQMLAKTLVENQQLTATYIVLAKSRTVESNVIKALNLPMDIKKLDGLISVDQLTTTSIIEIKAKADSAELSASIANTTARELSKAAVKETVGVVDKAVAPMESLQQNKKINVLAAFVIGLLASLGLVYLLETMRIKK